jgi:hypothetical protein
VLVLRDETDPDLDSRGFRGLCWLLRLRSSPNAGRFFSAGLGGGLSSALTGAAGGLCDFALGAESALLMVAAVWLEYPESLWTSMLWTTFSAAGWRSEPTEFCERLAATLAFSGGAGEVRGKFSSRTLSWSLSEW